MAMRYLIRTVNPNDLQALGRRIPDLQTQLGTPRQNQEKAFRVQIDADSHLVFQFVTVKVENEWRWVCPSTELVGRNEAALLKLTAQEGIARNTLSHLPV